MGAVKALWEETKLRKEEEEFLRYVSECKSQESQEENRKTDEQSDVSLRTVIKYGTNILFSIFFGGPAHDPKKERQEKRDRQKADKKVDCKQKKVSPPN